MKILLTGATGFVGSHTAEYFRQRGHEVFALVRPKSNHEFLKKMGVHLVFGELDKPELRKLSLPPVEALLHIAGAIKVKRPEDFHQINTEGTRYLLENIGAKNLKSFIFVSSISARGPKADLFDQKGMGPQSEYGKSKLKAEQLVMEMQKNPIIVRPPIVYGPGDRETLTLFKLCKRGIFPIVGGSQNRISFIYVKDLARMLEKMVTEPYAGAGPYYPDDGKEGYVWTEVSKIAEAVFQKKIFNFPIPLWSAKTVCAINDLAGKMFNFVPMMGMDKYRELRHPLWNCSHQNFCSHYSWEEWTDLSQGFREAYQWYLEQKWL